MNIALGSDHRGVEAKEVLKEYLKTLDCVPIDLGTNSLDSVDYPDYAFKVANMVVKDKVFGVLICGSGIGVSIAANRVKKIRAALCRTVDDSKMARLHNDANIICFGADVSSIDDMKEMLKTFLETSFESGRHIKRVEKLDS